MLFFDGIRVASEMAEVAYERLTKALETAALNTETARGALSRLVPLCFLDAWSIVDSTNRLRSLMQGLPNFRQRARSLQLFLRRTAGVVPLRNAVQHLNTEIDRLVENNVSVWGTLRWLVLLDANTGDFKGGTLVAGTQFGELHTLPNLSGIQMHDVVDEIVLTASGSELHIGNTVRAIQELIGKLEGVLATQLSEHPTAPSDFLVVAEMTITPKPAVISSNESAP
jgi:hypothetical protein